MSRCLKPQCNDLYFSPRSGKIDIYPYAISPHITEQELANYGDALVWEMQDRLPEEIREHTADCFECKLA